MELENKYNNSIVYKIVCNVTGLVYIGSTTQEIKTRLIKHKSNYKGYLAGNYGYTTSFKIIENGDYYIKKIKSYNFESKEELHGKEAYWIRRYGSVNKNIPNRTLIEYRNDHKVEKNARDKQYYLENKIELNTKQNLICLCVCGCSYSKRNKSRHLKSTIHLKLVEPI